MLLLAGIPQQVAFGQELDWAVRAGGTGFDQGRGIAVDGDGNSYVTGTFGFSATFGPGEANETVLEAGFSRELFVAKYDSGGALLWAKQAGGTGSFLEGHGIAVDDAGNSYVTGGYFGAATFGLGEVSETVLVGADEDIFVAKHDANGTLRSLDTSPSGAPPGASIASASR